MSLITRPRSSTTKIFSPPASMITPSDAPSAGTSTASCRCSSWNSSNERDPMFSDTTPLTATASTPSTFRSWGRNWAGVPCE